MTQTQKGFLGLLSAIALAPMLSTCGSGALASCGKVQPCGGDVVGSWTINGECVDTSSITMQVSGACPGVSIDASGIRITGNATFNADMTYTMNEMISASISESIPASCLRMNGVTVTCAQLDQAIQQELTKQPGVFQSAHCSGLGSCTCTLVLNPQTMNETGTYTTSGMSIALNGSTSEYCVQGNQLHLISLNTTMPMGPMGQANITADIVLTRN
ncbi:MAG TPA: hypothetical protein VN903_06395 [Polyangia bacterium]|nr:hypothetical protein [Polyangia bacterium]